MQQKKRIALRNVLIALAAGSVLLIGGVVLAAPARVQWEFERLSAYVRGVVSPVGEVPADTSEAPSQSQSKVFAPFTFTASSEATPAPAKKLQLPVTRVLLAPVFDPLRDYQDWNNCGPATLALGLRMFGWHGDQNTIAKAVKPERQDKNVNVEELAAYASTNAGLRAEIRYAGDLNRLKQFIAAGYPVIIEESFALQESFWPGDDLWSSHFVLLTGYDEANAVFISQDAYLGPDTKVDEAKLLKDWQAFNYVYLVLYPPQEEEVVKPLFGNDWSQPFNWQHAADLAAGQAQLDSQDKWAWFNLGTSLNGLQEYEKAWQAFNESRKLGLPQRMLRYQFGPFEAAYETDQIDDLSDLLTYALKITPNSEELLVWQGRLFVKQDQPDKARRSFLQALSFHPQYPEAEKALLALN